jgi:hypothetical protein
MIDRTLSQLAGSPVNWFTRGPQEVVALTCYKATYRFEVLVSDPGDFFDPAAAAPRWVVYDCDLVGEDDSTGEHHAEEVWSDEPVELAQQRLDEALADLAAFRGGLPSRIVLWTGEGSSENPAVVIQATEEQMSVGRLRAASHAVVDAVDALNQARKRLRNQVLAAEVRTHLARNLIAREVEGGGLVAPPGPAIPRRARRHPRRPTRSAPRLARVQARLRSAAVLR